MISKFFRKTFSILAVTALFSGFSQLPVLTATNIEGVRAVEDSMSYSEITSQFNNKDMASDIVSVIFEKLKRTESAYN